MQRILENRLDILPVLFLFLVGADIARRSLIEDLSVRHFDEAEKHFGKCGFAASGFTDNRDDLAFIEVKINVIHGRDLCFSGAEYLRDAASGEAGYRLLFGLVRSCFFRLFLLIQRLRARLHCFLYSVVLHCYISPSVS